MAMEPYSQHRQYSNNLQLKEYWGTAAPSATTDLGPFNVGDVMWNTAPAAGGGTRITLEHRDLERFGADAERVVAAISGGWPARLAEFVAYADTHL